MRSPVTMSHSCFAFPRRFQKGCGITDITDSDTNRRLFGQTPFRKIFPFYASDADRSTVKMSAFCNFSVTIKSDIFFFCCCCLVARARLIFVTCANQKKYADQSRFGARRSEIFSGKWRFWAFQEEWIKCVNVLVINDDILGISTSN